jgi:hypothetical protein
MAITSLPPTIVRPTVALRERGAQALLKIAPDLRVEPGKRTNARGFIVILGLIVFLNIMTLLLINTLMTQDAFTLENLKQQNRALVDQRDALINETNVLSSPDQLAAAAKKLGMVPATTIHYLDLSKAPVAPTAPVMTLVVPSAGATPSLTVPQAGGVK